MKKQLYIMLLSLSVLQMPSSAFAGRESGGGDPLALEFRATAEIALQNLQSMKGSPFLSVNISLLQNKINSAQIIVSDNVLPIAQFGVTQDGAAENHPTQNLIILNRQDYSTIENAAVQQALALHEYLSLVGIESTANYPISGAYLIAENGGSASSASQAISSASKSISTQNCAQPNPDASTLFSMIENPSISAAAIQSFLKNHAIAVDALNEHCETGYDIAIDLDRQDVYRVLFNYFSLPIDIPESAGASDSIYSYVLGHGSTAMLSEIENLEFSITHEVPNLDDVTLSGGLYADGTTELMVAAEFNSSSDMIRFLIKNGSLVNSTDSNGQSALMYAASQNANVAVTQALIQAGATVDEAPSGYALSGATALMYAASQNANVAVTQALIQAGANVNAVDSKGATALMYAASQNENVAVTQALIQAGANVGAADSKGATALMYATCQNTNVAVTKALIQAGANVNAVTSEGNTALMCASYGNTNVAVTQTLIQSGANVNAANSNGVTALLNGVGDNTNVAVIMALIQAGADVNAADSNRLSALMYAAFPLKNDVCPGGLFSSCKASYQEPLQDQIIQTLIQGGANVKAKDSSGRTALDIAKTYGAPQTMLTLLGGSSSN